VTSAMERLPPRTVLIVCLRRIGDVLLTTPLAASMRSAWPESRITWLVFDGSQGPLEASAAADDILLLPERPSIAQSLRLLARIWQHFDLAVSAQAGDRPNWFARFASAWAVGMRSSAAGGFLRDVLMTQVVAPPERAHRIEQVLALCTALKITPQRQLLLPLAREPSETVAQPYWVLHPGAAFVYKQWNREGWRTLVGAATHEGIGVVVTGGGSEAEVRYLDELFEGLNVLRLDGRLSWQELVWVLERAQWFIGVDTSVTHLAAAVNERVVPIFGPTDPLLWAPITKGAPIPVLQQALHPCQPCQLEGCDRHIRSRSKCLDELGADQVMHFMRAQESSKA
jgi:heptosyltransferase III